MTQCLSCGAKGSPVVRPETVRIRGRTIVFNSVVTECYLCGANWETAGQLDANLDEARRVRACATG